MMIGNRNTVTLLMTNTEEYTPKCPLRVPSSMETIKHNSHLLNSLTSNKPKLLKHC